MAWMVYDSWPAPDQYSYGHKGYRGIGPLACKRWIKRADDPPHKMNYKRRPSESPDNHKSREAYNADRAFEYVKWLLARDGIKLTAGAHRPIHDGVMIGNKWHPRIRGIAWGYEKEVYNIRKNGRRGAFLHNEWIETSRIEIPNWNFVHPPLQQES